MMIQKNKQNNVNNYLEKIILLAIIICLFNSFSCEKHDEFPIVNVKPDWVHNLHKNGIQSNSIVRANLINENIVIIATTDGNENRYLSGVNINDGNELWRWNDIYQSPTEYFDIDYYASYNNLLFYQNGTRSYCIKTDDGSTFYKNRGTISYDVRLTNYESKVLLNGETYDSISGQFAYSANIMDINSGIIKPFLYPPFDSASINTSYHGIDDFSHLLITSNGQYLVTTYAYVNLENNVVSKLGLYNLDTNSWIYYNENLTDEPKWYTSVLQPPVVVGNKIFLNVGKSILCHDFWTGKRIWKVDFNADFLFSGFIVKDNQLLANCENGIFYCINPETGVIKWHVDGAGTSTPLRYLNGIVYFSGGSTGRIHAIDTNTGEYVWMLDPSNYDHQEDFKPDLYVKPGESGEKGKVIICTPEKAYCLPAYR